MQIQEESLAQLEAHARISIAFDVTSVFDVTARDAGLAGFALSERPVLPVVRKDYDAYAGSHPSGWSDQFDLAHWGLLSAWEGDERLGGAVIAFDTKGLHLLEGRRDLAVLWDLRIAERARRGGIGASLFAAACNWAAARGCVQLKIETQNINVPACKFYASQGCALREVQRFAYPELPEEIQLLWYKNLAEGGGAAAGLGLDKHFVRLVPHHSGWAEAFAREAVRLQSAAARPEWKIEHIGSTSVPGLHAKPVLDIAIGVACEADLASAISAIATLGYEYVGDAGSEGGHVLMLESAPGFRTHHVHVVTCDDPQWETYLQFRDLLKRDQAARDVYAAEKIRLAELHASDRNAYTAAKDEIVRALLRD